MKKFRKIYVEITNICNMKCSFCPETKRAKAFMDLTKFENIVKQIKPYTDYIYLHVKGEPLLHPKLNEVLDICKRYDLKVNISTNGVLLKEKWEILKNIRQLNVSLHSFEKQDKEEMYEYIKTVVSLSNKLAKNGVIIRYKLWNAKEDSYTNNVEIIKYLEKMYSIKLENTTYIKDIKLDENIFISIKTPFKWPDLSGINQIETTCYGLKYQIAILVDGTVVPCCVDNDGDINLGNIFEENLTNILNSKKALAIKKGFEDNKCIHELCKKCEYRIHVT